MSAQPENVVAELNLAEAGLYTVIRFATENGLSDDEAFALAERQAQAALKQLFLYELHRFQRSYVRIIEQAVDRKLEIATTPQDRVAARRMLAEETFSLEDGSSVLWERATPEQHRARAAWQRKLAGECIADAERHEQAAREIEEAGVRCLRDLAKKSRVR